MEYRAPDAHEEITEIEAEIQATEIITNRLREQAAKARLTTNRIEAGTAGQNPEEILRIGEHKGDILTDGRWVEALREIGITNRQIVKAWERKDELSRGKDGLVEGNDAQTATEK